MKWLSGFIQLDNHSCPNKVENTKQEAPLTKSVLTCASRQVQLWSTFAFWSGTFLSPWFLETYWPCHVLFHRIHSCIYLMISLGFFRFDLFFSQHSEAKALGDPQNCSPRGAFRSDMNSSSPCGEHREQHRGWENSPWCEEGSPSTIHELQVKKSWMKWWIWLERIQVKLELQHFVNVFEFFLGFRWQSCDVSVSFLVLVAWKVQREVYPGADGTPGKSWGNNRKARTVCWVWNSSVLQLSTQGNQ